MSLISPSCLEVKRNNHWSIQGTGGSGDKTTSYTGSAPFVFHGLYTGIIGVAGFTEFGIDIGATAVSGTQPITATLCISCSAIHNTPATFNGMFTATGTPTNTFLLVSDPFVEHIAGLTVTKMITLSGVVLSNGGTISGTYSEQSIDQKGPVTLLASELYASRPKRVPGAITPTVTIGLSGPGGFPSVSWTGSEANCSYQLYRSGSPYFVNYPRQVASSTADLSFTDIYPATVSQPIFYRLRALSCDANFDYLEKDATYYRDSIEIGAFDFAITPAN